MASGSQNMTTYNARTVTGSNSAASPAGALLLSGAGRADNATGDTWIFLDSAGGTDTPWGIKHDQANNKIHIYGSNTDSVWTRMNTGDTYILGKVGIGYNPETSGNSYKLYVNGSTYFNGDTTHNGNLIFTNSGTSFRGINYGTMGDNDQWRIGGAATASNAGYMEIATADDGNEPIYVRQYTGVFSSLTRTLTLLDANGNTIFPGKVTATGGYADRTNGTATFLNYGASGLAASAMTWFTCWNGYELRAISKAETMAAIRGAASGTWGISITGNAATASKLGTATVGGANRGIYLNAGTATAVSWYHNSCSINGGNTANYPWHRFATCTTGTGQYVDKSVIVIFHARFDGGRYGAIKLSVRTNSSGTAMNSSAVWLYRYGFAANEVKITTGGTTGTDTRFNAWVKCGGWPRMIAYILEGSNNGWSLINSHEPDNCTAASQGTEINASVSGADATDGCTVSYANSAGSANSVAWANVSSKPATATRWPSWSEVTGKPSTFAPSSHTHSYLPLSGGDMTGSIRQKMTSVTRGAKPGSNQYRTYEWIDSGGKRVAQVEYGMQTNGESRLHLYVLGNNNTSTGDEYGGIVIYKNVGVSGNTIATYNANNGRFAASSVSNAIWNDIAESRRSNIQEPGYVIIPSNDNIAKKTSLRLQPACRITSDTYGYLLGDEDNEHVPVAIAGRVLAYPYKDKSEYKIGDAVCSAPGGTIDIMTREEIMMYPDRIIGIVNEIPDYDIWEPSREGGGREPVHTNGRIWIDVR